MTNETKPPARLSRRAVAAGLIGAAAAVACSRGGEASPPAPSLPRLPAAFPVAPHSSRRYLVDANGNPFPILGRTMWFVSVLSVPDYQLLLDDAAARGYNAVEFHVPDRDLRGNRPPFAGNGAAPFLKQLDGGPYTGSFAYTDIHAQAPDFTTPNPAFWNYVDGIIAYMELKGMLCFVFPAYVGAARTHEGWMDELIANGPTKMQAYGAWIADRYKDQKNLVWMLGGDRGTSPTTFTSAEDSVERALLSGLKSVPDQQSTQFSAEWGPESIGTDQTSYGTTMTLNGAYSWNGDVATHGRRAYAHSPTLPAYLLEEPYDEEGPDGNHVNPHAIQPTRRFQWWGWLSTIGGYISGNGYVVQMSPVWRSHLDTQGTRDMTRLNAFIRSINWHELVPSGLGGMKRLVTSGGNSPADADYVAAAATPAGDLLIAYIPPAHSGPITIDMTAMSGTARARWFDPTSATYTSIGTFTNTGTHSFVSTRTNSRGEGDWVLVLDHE